MEAGNFCKSLFFRVIYAIIYFFRQGPWKQIKKLMDHSLFFRGVDALFAFIQRVFSASITAKLFTGHINEEVYNASLFVRFVRQAPQLFVHLRRRFKPAYDGSGWSALMRNLGALAQGSFAVRALFRFLGIELNKPVKLSRFPLALLFTGIVAASAAFLFFPPLYAAIGAGGFIGALSVLAFPELGVIAVTAAAPFLPTMVVAAMLGYTAVCYCVKLMTNARYAPFIDHTGLTVVLYAGIGIFYGFTSFHPASSIRIAMLTTLLMLGYLLTTALIDSRRKFNTLIFTFCTSAALTGVVGAYQKLSGKVDMTWVDKQLFSDLTLRVSSTFANPNVYGSYLLLVIPVCMIMIHTSSRLVHKLYYLLITGLLIYNLGLTYSRGCYLALVAGLIIYIFFIEKRLITLFTAGIFILPAVIPASILRRVLSITNLSDSSTSYRIYIWQATLRILKDFWFSGLGQGIEAYNVVYPYYAFSDVTAPHSHNLYLQVFTELGIFGLIAFLLMILTFFRTLLKLFYKTRNTKTKSFLAALFAAAAAFLMQGMFDYVFYNYRVMLTFFIFMGIGGAMVNIRLKEDFC